MTTESGGKVISLDVARPDQALVGRIVAARAALRTSEVDDEKVVRRASLPAYLSPGRFAEVDESRAFPFPAGSER